jgi:hypothetical protein
MTQLNIQFNDADFEDEEAVEDPGVEEEAAEEEVLETTEATEVTVAKDGAITKLVGRVINADGTTSEYQKGESLCSVVCRSLTAKKISSEFYTTERLNYPLGFNCPEPPWGPSLYNKIQDRLLKAIDGALITNSMADLLTLVCPVFNQHLLFDVQTGKICFRRLTERSEGKFTDLGCEPKEFFLKSHADEFQFKFKFEGDKYPKIYSLLKLWADSSLKAKFNGRIFLPCHAFDEEYCQRLPVDSLNSFYGLLHPWEDAIKEWRTNVLGRILVARWLLHTCYVICDGHKDKVWYFLTWFAKKVFQPYWRPHTCLVIQGREGR